MFNILLTGSRGFIGKNLLKKLHCLKFNILEFNREDSFDKLKEYIFISDFIIHLAAEVRPYSLKEDFEKSNILLTKNIIDLLAFWNKKIPILMTSTIHAKLLQNEYGKTKREAELLIENYSNESNAKCIIYRLPHVFGEGCKPNYNSVISTWIYNSLHNLDINCFDRGLEMSYVYVQDIVSDIEHILENMDFHEIYIQPEKIYKTTLGDVVDMINEFKQNINVKNYSVGDSEFKTKLFKTYLYYYRNLDVWQ